MSTFVAEKMVKGLRDAIASGKLTFYQASDMAWEPTMEILRSLPSERKNFLGYSRRTGHRPPCGGLILLRSGDLTEKTLSLFCQRCSNGEVVYSLFEEGSSTMELFFDKEGRYNLLDLRDLYR